MHGEADEGPLAPLHAMPFRSIRTRSQEFVKSQFARLLVHACSVPIRFSTYALDVDQNELAKDKSLRLLAGEYADLLSIQQDLAFASQSARKFSVLDQTEDADGVLRRALWGAAVVAYDVVLQAAGVTDLSNGQDWLCHKKQLIC